MNIDKGLKSENENQPESALNSYNEAIKICSTFAETHYRLGKVYEKMGRYDEAWSSYNRAIDNDKMPIRAQSLQNQFISKIEEKNNLKVVDAVAYLRDHSQNKLIGYNFMSDGHHPNILGHMLISEMFAKEIAKMYPKNTNFTAMQQTEAESIFNTNNGLMTMLTGRAEWLYRIATWTYDPTERLKKADEYLDQAISMHPDWAEMYLDKMVISYLRKDKKAADNYYEMAQKRDPFTTTTYMKNTWVSQIIYRAMAQ